MQATEELEELRITLDRIRTLLETLAVRGLRACGPDELAQLGSYAEHLEQVGAGHLAGLLADLRGLVERDERSAARKLLETQTNVRLLERLLTLRVVKAFYAAAVATPDAALPESTAVLGTDDAEVEDDDVEDDDVEDDDVKNEE